jgi:hypothetical protein
MNWTCFTSGCEEKLMQSFGVEYLMGKNNLEDLGIDGRIILLRF